jgi:hypothetical protein
LAGYILQVRAGIPFARYVQQKLFNPVGMNRSSFDWRRTRADKNRAIGHRSDFPQVPLEFALIPAGGLYSNVIDMSKYLRFQINHGKVDNKQVLHKKYLDEMLSTGFPEEVLPSYGLGISIWRGLIDNVEIVSYGHGGGGFGFSTHMFWNPKDRIGIAILTNSTSHPSVQLTLTAQILHKLRGKYPKNIGKTNLEVLALSNIVTSQLERYSGTYLPERGDVWKTFSVVFKGDQFGITDRDTFFPIAFNSKDGSFSLQPLSNKSGEKTKYFTYGNKANYRFIVRPEHRPIVIFSKSSDKVIAIQQAGLKDTPGPNKKEWKKYIGFYDRKVYGKSINSIRVFRKNGYLYLENVKLTEYQPGLFFSVRGEAVDFRSDPPTYRNIKLYRNKEKIIVNVNPDIYDAYTGQYEFAPDEILIVTKRGNKLYIKGNNDQGEVEIFPKSEMTFFAGLVEVGITFVKDMKGEVTHLILNKNGEHYAKKIQ